MESMPFEIISGLVRKLRPSLTTYKPLKLDKVNPYISTTKLMDENESTFGSCTNRFPLLPGGISPVAM